MKDLLFLIGVVLFFVFYWFGVPVILSLISVSAFDINDGVKQAALFLLFMSIYCSVWIMGLLHYRNK